MKYEIIEMPCELVAGDKVKTADGRIREVESIGGRFITFTDGTQFSLSHPDILGKAIEKKKKQKQEEE